MPPEPRVLVVDDSVVARHVLVLTLRQLPEFAYATIDQAGNGAIALKQLASERYDLVLSDIRMPLMDGLEMVSKLRNEMADHSTPVVLISTLGTEEDVQRGLAAGADAYVLKPLLPHTIQTAIRDFLDSRHRPAAAAHGSGQKT